MNEKQHKMTLMQLQTSPRRRVAVTAAIMVALILLVYYCNIPNPNMILIAGLVLCSALYGYWGGIVAAVIMFFYTLFFFSTNHSFTHFTVQNLQKVFVSLIGIAADMILVCQLKRAEVESFREVDALTEKLREENEHLKSISLTDGLTGLRNRMALRQDFNSYLHHEVTVMMLDLDSFKSINDTNGHEEGDRVLRETGKLLADTFGAEHCYRFGGDEFLVIVPDLSMDAFNEKLKTLMASRPTLTTGGKRRPVGYSVGCVHETLNNPHSLRRLFSVADERMYQAKREASQNVFRSAGDAVQPGETDGRLKPTEYTVKEMTSLLREMAESYDLARVVDPIECRVLQFGSDGQVSMRESCYGIWNADQRCINCSSAAACQTGRTQKKAELFQDQLFHIQSTPVKLKLPDGGAYDAVVELVNIEAELTAGSYNDRAAENRDDNAARFQARHDSLTKVLNEGAFYEGTRKAILLHPNAHWVMVSANIQDFRLVNTLFGDQRGNEVLVKTAAVLRGIADQADGLCARLGGDHFALFLPRDAFREESLTEAARTLTEEFSSGLYTFRIHFGIYEIQDAAIPVSVMCDRANSALHTIREDPRESVAFFDEAMMQKSLFEQEIVSAFDDALRNGEFRMYLQPIVKEDGEFFGAEALVRWCRPDGVVIMPAQFIETLERVGKIHLLDTYIWECAVRQLARWTGTEMEHLTISVNMSARDFYSVDIYGVLTALLEKYHVASSRLRLEITETALLEEPEQGDAIVSNLRRTGFLVEIDDFGKGYSSLMMLKDIRADVLKVDMSLLSQIETEQRDRTILASVIGMADSLGMEVISEGVENETQLQSLSSMGCKCFQGFYFSRPVTVEEFEKKYAALRQRGGRA